MDGFDATSVLDTPVDGLETDVAEEPVETGLEDTETVEDDGTGEGEGEGTVDGRKLPAQVRSFLKTAKESDPAQAGTIKELGDGYFRYQAYKQVFPKVEDARAASAALQAIGGQDGIADIQSRIADMEEVDALLASGDVSVLDRVAEIAGEGLVKLAPAFIDRVAQQSPEAFGEMVRPHLVAALNGAGLGTVLGQLAEAFEMSNMPGASAEFKQAAQNKASTLIKNMMGWLQQQNEAVQNSKKNAVNPSEQKLSEREKALQAKEENSFREGIRSTTSSHFNEVTGKALGPYLKQLNLSTEAKRDLAQGVIDEVSRLMEGDQAYQKQVKALLSAKNRDAKRIASFINAKIDAIAEQATKSVVMRRYGNTLNGKRSAAQGGKKPGQQKPTTAAAGAPVRIAQKPDRSLIDYDKTSDMDLVQGRATLKNGKRVSWR
jgi:hypothetical protein